MRSMCIIYINEERQKSGFHRRGLHSGDFSFQMGIVVMYFLTVGADRAINRV